MRFPLGFSILLVLILGLLCASSMSHGEETQDIESPAGQLQSQAESEPVENPDDKTQQTKRQMGMPADVASATGGEVSVTPEAAVSSENQQEPAPPVNPPESTPMQAETKDQEPAQEAETVVKTTARGITDNFMPSYQQAQAPGNKILQPMQVNQDDLPKIIENNRQVTPNSQLSNQPNIATEMPAKSSTPAPQPSTNTSQTMSSARTFDSWTSCVGSSTNKYGTCKNDVECDKNRGRADGSCMGGLGVCCVMALTCNDKSLENNTFFANPDYPEPSWEARLCEVEVQKKSKNVLQVMIEFEDFELAPPNQFGECVTDIFTIKLASNKPSPYSLLKICGQNTGQHIYLDVSQIDEPIVLSLATSGGGFPRRWSIRIVQMDEKNHLLAPPGCLQYYTDTVGHFRSFNLGMNLKHLYYAICFRIDNGYSGLRFTENFFGMNGPTCRKRLGGGHANATFGAHPHHLVIPPPGLGHHLGNYQQPQQPLIREYPGRLQPQVIQGRFKRLAYAEYNNRYTRTHPEGEFKSADKEFKQEKYAPSYGESQYGPVESGYKPLAPTYGPAESGYQTPAPAYGPAESGYKAPTPTYGSSYGQAPGYGQDYQYNKEYKGEWKGAEGHYEHKKPAESSWGIGKWGEAFGWSGGAEAGLEKNKHEHHEGHHHGQSYGGYGQASYKPQTYGAQSYGPQAYGPPAYGPPAQGPQNYGPQAYKQPAYGPPSYGPPAYGPPINYHNKEINKFGEKYEHLEYKQEKNHHEKEKSSSWWPSWGKKEEKKDKDKFNMHHEALFPMIRMPEMPQCEPRFCGTNDVITFPPSGESLAEMCGNRFNRGRGPKIISGSPLVVYVSNKGHNRGAGFDMNYEQVFFIPNRY